MKYFKKENSFISIILARGGSKGIKKKNLVLVNNKPLIYWSINHCLKSKNLDSVWVSSDDKKILKYSKKIGANIIKRPKLYAAANSSSESAWLHAINYLKKKIDFNYIVGIQPTSPIRKVNDIDKAIKLFKKKNYDSMFSATEINDFFVWKKKKNKLMANYMYKKRPRRQEIKNNFLENGSLYIFKKKEFLKYKNRLFGKIGIYLMNKIPSLQIDDYEDLKLINSLKKFF